MWRPIDSLRSTMLLTLALLPFSFIQEVQAPLTAEQLQLVGCRTFVQQLTEANMASQTTIVAWQQEAQRLVVHSEALERLTKAIEDGDELAIDLAATEARGLLAQ